MEEEEEVFDTQTISLVTCDYSSPYMHTYAHTQVPATTRSMHWLAEHVTTPYWDPSNPEYVSIATYRSSRPHPACNMATNWAAYREMAEPFFTSLESVELTETQVVRETLW